MNRRGWLLAAGAGALIVSALTLPRQEEPSQLSRPPAPLETAPLSLSSPPQEEERSKELRRLLEVKFGSGDYEGALALAISQLEEGNLEPAYRSWLQRQLPILRTSLGWVQLHLGDCVTAIETLNAALKDQVLPEALKGLAHCRHRLKEWNEAAVVSQQFLAREPNDAQMLWLYAESLESLQQFELAVQVWEKLAALEGAQSEQASHRLSAMRAKLKESAHQTTIETSRVIVTYRATEHENLAALTVQTIEDALHEWQQDYGLPDAPAKIEVLLYPDNRFQDLVSYGPKWSGGVFDGRMRIPVSDRNRDGTDLKNFQKVLRHELTHAVLHELAAGRQIPSWVQEGVAQFWECAGGCRDFTFPAAAGEFLPMNAFEGSFTGASEVEAVQLYRQSLYLILAAYHDAAGRGSNPISLMIDTLARPGSLVSDALLAPSGLDFKRLHQISAHYWRSRQRL